MCCLILKHHKTKITVIVIVIITYNADRVIESRNVTIGTCPV